MNIKKSTVTYHLNGCVQNADKDGFGKRMVNMDHSWHVIATQNVTIQENSKYD
jgi:hypothetical protein